MSDDVSTEVTAYTANLASVLPPDVALLKFQQVVMAAIRAKPELEKCNRQSLFNACLAAAQDGLLPDGREGAIVPRKGIAVWQPMIVGIIKKVKTSGSVATLSANVVYDGEHFEVQLGDEERIVHRREMDLIKGGEEIAVYAVATLKDGTKEREVMSWGQVEAVRKSSATPNSGPWVEWPDQMAKKTVIRRLAKRLPVLDEGDEALQRTIERVDALYDYGQTTPPKPEPETSKTKTKKSGREAINEEVKLTPKNLWARDKLAMVDKWPHLSEEWVKTIESACPQAKHREDLEALVDVIRHRLETQGQTKEAVQRIGNAIQISRKRLAAQPTLEAEKPHPMMPDGAVDPHPVDLGADIPASETVS